MCHLGCLVAYPFDLTMPWNGQEFGIDASLLPNELLKVGVTKKNKFVKLAHYPSLPKARAFTTIFAVKKNGLTILAMNKTW